MNPYLGLVLVAVLWGTSFPIIRVALHSVSGPEFVMVRFFLAGAFFLVVLLSRSTRQEIWRILWPGLWIGLLNYLIFTSQTIALETLNGPRVAFITGTYVVFVPIWSWLGGKHRPTLLDWGATALAFLGLTILAWPFGESTGLQWGDICTLFCALCASIKIHSVRNLAVRGGGALATSFLQVMGVVACYLITLPVMPSSWFQGTWTWEPVLCVLFCAWGISIGTFYLQTYCQRHVPPEQSAIIYCLEPVFATIFSYLFIGEKLTTAGLMGGALIVLAQIYPLLIPRNDRGIRNDSFT